jgi:hypothetical protein
MLTDKNIRACRSGGGGTGITGTGSTGGGAAAAGGGIGATGGGSGFGDVPLCGSTSYAPRQCPIITRPFLGGARVSAATTACMRPSFPIPAIPRAADYTGCNLESMGAMCLACSYGLLVGIGRFLLL